MPGSCYAGGKRDPTDVSAEATAVREMTEETGGERRKPPCLCELWSQDMLLWSLSTGVK